MDLYGLTQLQVQGITVQEQCPSSTMFPKYPATEVEVILRNYANIVRPCTMEQPVKHTITHCINTVRPPVHARPYRLPSERLKTAKEHFKHMLQVGTVCPLSSS